MDKIMVVKCTLCGRQYGTSIYHLKHGETIENTPSPCGHSRVKLIPLLPIERPSKK